MRSERLNVRGGDEVRERARTPLRLSTIRDCDRRLGGSSSRRRTSPGVRAAQAKDCRACGRRPTPRRRPRAVPEGRPTASVGISCGAPWTIGGGTAFSLESTDTISATPVRGVVELSPPSDGRAAPLLGRDVAHRLRQLPAVPGEVLEHAGALAVLVRGRLLQDATHIGATGDFPAMTAPQHQFAPIITNPT